MTQMRLGSVLSAHGERASGEQGAQYLRQSMAAYRAALEVCTRERLPQDWAMTQYNLGNLLSALGERASGEQGAQYLQQSVAAYRAALEVYTREQSPQDWAMTQNNLGNVLSALGERASGEQGAQYLQQSVAAYRAASGVTGNAQIESLRNFELAFIDEFAVPGKRFNASAFDAKVNEGNAKFQQVIADEKFTARRPVLVDLKGQFDADAAHLRYKASGGKVTPALATEMKTDINTIYDHALGRNLRRN